MKAKYSEAVEIISKLDGSLRCQLRWQDRVWEEALPRNIERWPMVEFKAHVAGVTQRLRLEMLKAQREALDTGKIDPELCLPTVEMSATDADKFARAREKRARKAEKLKIVH